MRKAGVLAAPASFSEHRATSKHRVTGTADKVMITGEFYEWGGPKKERQPYWFHRPDYAFVLLAGMW